MWKLVPSRLCTREGPTPGPKRSVYDGLQEAYHGKYIQTRALCAPFCPAAKYSNTEREEAHHFSFWHHEVHPPERERSAYRKGSQQEKWGRSVLFISTEYIVQSTWELKILNRQVKQSCWLALHTSQVHFCFSPNSKFFAAATQPCRAPGAALGRAKKKGSFLSLFEISDPPIPQIGPRGRSFSLDWGGKGSHGWI